MTAQRIIQHIFKEPGLEKVTQWELEKLVTDYPFFTGARMLLAKRSFQRSSDLQHDAVIKALLYSSAPHYLYQFVQSPPDVIAAVAAPVEATAATLENEVPAPVAVTEEAISNVAAAHTDEADAAQQIDQLLEAAKTEDLVEAGQLSVDAYEAIEAEATGDKTPEAVLDTHELDVLETGNLSVDVYEALHADEESAPLEATLDTHELDVLEAGKLSVDAYEAIITEKAAPENIATIESSAQPEAEPHHASPAEAILETTTGSFGTTAPELAIAFTQHITPADEKPRLSFHEEMEAFRRELAEQQQQDATPGAPVAIAPIATAAPAEEIPALTAEAPAESEDTSDFHLRMEAFRQSLLASADTAEEGATDQSVSEEEAAVLQNFNVHSFQDELEALKNSFTVDKNTGASVTDTLEAGAFAAAEALETEEPVLPEAADATLETGAIAPPHSHHAEPALGEVSSEDAGSLAHTLEAGARDAIIETESKEGLEAALEAAAEGLPDFIEETPAFPAATLAAEAATLADHEPAFATDHPADIQLATDNTPDLTEQELNAADIQLVSDAINDQLLVPPTSPAAEENTPRITAWMPQQRPVVEEAPGVHASVTLPTQSEPESTTGAAPEEAFAETPGLAAQDAAPQHLTEEAAEAQENYEEGPIKIYPLEMPEETDLTFQPLYSDDYFAYKKLADPVAAETMSEKGAKEMKSFTNWLRTMKDSFAEKTQKDWYHEQLHRVYEEEEESGISERVEKMALQSITLNDDIVSETLAEIWARQRQHQKAIQIYKKLSLLNPGKSAYFAQKINELQSDINK